MSKEQNRKDFIDAALTVGGIIGTAITQRPEFLASGMLLGVGDWASRRLFPKRVNDLLREKVLRSHPTQEALRNPETETHADLIAKARQQEIDDDITLPSTDFPAAAGA